MTDDRRVLYRGKWDCDMTRDELLELVGIMRTCHSADRAFIAEMAGTPKPYKPYTCPPGWAPVDGPTIEPGDVCTIASEASQTSTHD